MPHFLATYSHGPRWGPATGSVRQRRHGLRHRCSLYGVAKRARPRARSRASDAPANSLSPTRRFARDVRTVPRGPGRSPAARLGAFLRRPWCAHREARLVARARFAWCRRMKAYDRDDTNRDEHIDLLRLPPEQASTAGAAARATNLWPHYRSVTSLCGSRNARIDTWRSNTLLRSPDLRPSNPPAPYSSSPYELRLPSPRLRHGRESPSHAAFTLVTIRPWPGVGANTASSRSQGVSLRPRGTGTR